MYNFLISFTTILKFQIPSCPGGAGEPRRAEKKIRHAGQQATHRGHIQNKENSSLTGQNGFVLDVPVQLMHSSMADSARSPCMSAVLGCKGLIADKAALINVGAIL